MKLCFDPRENFVSLALRAYIVAPELEIGYSDSSSVTLSGPPKIAVLRPPWGLKTTVNSNFFNSLSVLTENNFVPLVLKKLENSRYKIWIFGRLALAVQLFKSRGNNFLEPF